MSNVISIPKANPLKFYHQREVFSSRVGDNYASSKPWQNSKNIDEDFYLLNVQEWLSNKAYYQPWQNSDVIPLYFIGLNKISSTIPYIIRVLDCNGKAVKTIEATWIADIGTQSIYSAEIKLWDIEQGFYGVQIRFQDTINAGVPWEYFISEPIEVKEFHKGTKLVKYKHSENAYGVYYEEGARFMIRVHAELLEFKPESKFEVYEDDPRNLEMLGGESFREYTFTIGGNKNIIPDWLIDKFEVISIHDYMSIDSTLYTRTEGAKLEIDRSQSTALSSCKLNVREKYSQNSLHISTFNHAVILSDAYNDYFYAKEIEFPNSGPGVTIAIENYFKNSNQFVNYLNQEIPYLYGLTWSTEGCYVAINAENKVTIFVDNTTAEGNVEDASINGVMANYVALGTELEATLGDSVTIDFDLNTPASTKYAVFYNDGSSNVIATDADGSISLSHTFTKKATAFYFVEQFDTVAISGDPIVYSLRGKLTDTTTDFDLSSNSLKYIDNNIFKALAVQSINLSGNKLSTAEIDKAVIMAYESLKEGYLTATCTIDLSGQQPISQNEGINYLKSLLKSNSITISI